MKDCISVRPKKIVYATSKQRSQPGSRAILVGKTASGRAALAYVDVKDIGIMGPQLAQFNPKAKLGFMPMKSGGTEGFAASHGIYLLAHQLDVHAIDAYDAEMGNKYFTSLDNIFSKIPTNPKWARVPLPVQKGLGSEPNDTRNKYFAAFINGQRDIDTDLDEIIAEYRKAGYDKTEVYVHENYSPQ